MNSLHALMARAHNNLEKELDAFLNSTKSNGSIKTTNNFVAFI